MSLCHMFMRMCICANIYVCVHMYLCMHVHVYVCMSMFSLVCMHLYVCTCICLHAHMIVCTCANVYVCLCVCMSIHIQCTSTHASVDDYLPTELCLGRNQSICNEYFMPVISRSSFVNMEGIFFPNIHLSLT